MIKTEQSANKVTRLFDYTVSVSAATKERRRYNTAGPPGARKIYCALDGKFHLDVNITFYKYARLYEENGRKMH